VGKVAGQITALNSKTVMGNQLPAPATIQDLFRSGPVPLDFQVRVGMMNLDRTDELRGLLREHLRNESVAKQLDDHGRVLWLSERLEDYVDRLQGFSVALPANVAAVAASDFTRAVVAGVSVLDEYLTATDTPSHVNAAWLAFKATLSDLTRDPDLRHVEALRIASQRFRTVLATADW
jgi:hypothetical protein